MVKVGDVIKVKVAEVKPYAAFVYDENRHKGMVHISELSDTFIRDIDKFVAIDDEMSVIILNIDETDGFFRASYKQVPADKKTTTHVNMRRALETNEEEFASLKEKLPIWIEDSLKRNEGK